MDEHNFLSKVPDSGDPMLTGIPPGEKIGADQTIVNIASVERENFNARAVAFYQDYLQGVGFRKATFHGSTIEVGMGKYEGLLIKHDLQVLSMVFDYLRRLFKDEEMTPEKYSLVELPHRFVAPGVGVQEFLEAPTLKVLEDFLRGQKNPVYLEGLSERDRTLCADLLKTPGNEGITYDILRAADQELYEHTKRLRRYGRSTVISEKNILVLGREKGDGRIIIAPIDLE
jgi:hypothetical protein